MSEPLRFRTADECHRLAYEALQAGTGLAPRERGFLVNLAVEYELLARALEEDSPPPCRFEATVSRACSGLPSSRE